MLLVVLAAAFVSPASADIYKCSDEHGNVAYLQLPCPAEREKPAATEESDDSVAVEDDVELEPAEMPAAPSSRLPGEPLDACKKRYRDQIDAVEAELFSTDLADRSESFKERLLALTQQLRACD